MPQNRVDIYPDPNRRIWVGRFHDLKERGKRPPKADLCTFDEALYTKNRRRRRSDTEILSYLRPLFEEKRANLIEELNFIPEENIDNILLADAIEEFNEYNLPKYSATWQRSLKYYLEFWLKELGNIPIKSITQKKILKIRNKMECKNSNKNRYYSGLSALLTSCVLDHEDDDGNAYLDVNPLHGLNKLDKLPEEENYGIALNMKQIELMLKNSKAIMNIHKSDPDKLQKLNIIKNKDFHLLIHLALYSGARGDSELIKLKWDDYDGKKLRFRKTKNKHERICPIIGKVKEHLDSTAHYNDSIFLYRDYRRKWKKLVQKSKFNFNRNLRFHDLRHSTVTFLLENGVPHMTVASIVGHSSAKMVKHYNQIHPEHLIESMKTIDKQLNVT